MPRFLGTNLPWHWFGYDVGGGAFDLEWFAARFRAVGGEQNVQRLFLHADGRATPAFSAEGFVAGLAQPAHGGAAAFKSEMMQLVGLAAKHRRGVGSLLGYVELRAEPLDLGILLREQLARGL